MEETLDRSENEVNLQDIAAVAFRRRRLISITFLSVLSGAIAIAVFQPNRYEAAMKILVKRDRADAIVTSDANAVAPSNGTVTEEELNSEAVLLKSTDLLEKIVVACNLQRHTENGGFKLFARLLPQIFTEEKPARISGHTSPAGLAHPTAGLSILPVLPETGVHLDVQMQPQTRQLDALDVLEREPAISAMPAFHYSLAANISPSPRIQSDWPSALATIGVHPTPRTPEENIGIARAVQALDKALRVDVVKKTNMIGATYQSSSPQLAAQVLATLANLYVEKHVEVHRPAGAYDFFQREAQKYGDELNDAEKRLVDFDREAEVVSAPLEKEVTIQKLADLQLSFTETEGTIAETQRRIEALQQTEASLPSRMVTQVRNADDGMLLSQLKTNLLTLEQRRVELLSKFEPGYRSVQEIDAQIAAARAALAEKSQLHEETTDRDPTYEWTRAELAKSGADLAGLQARARAMALAVRSYQANARLLASKEVIQADLMRAVKAAEDNYMLSLRKEEEARISDALDRGRILNVAVADKATVPTLPSNHRLRIVLFGALLAAFFSMALAFVAERTDPTFRTPDEVVSILNTPVVAAIPKNGKSSAPSYA
jgi:uncharacterized protein involved in exopolysaccharide biosynthesis